MISQGLDHCTHMVDRPCTSDSLNSPDQNPAGATLSFALGSPQICRKNYPKLGRRGIHKPHTSRRLLCTVPTVYSRHHSRAFTIDKICEKIPKEVYTVRWQSVSQFYSRAEADALDSLFRHFVDFKFLPLLPGTTTNFAHKRDHGIFQTAPSTHTASHHLIVSLQS